MGRRNLIIDAIIGELAALVTAGTVKKVTNADSAFRDLGKDKRFDVPCLAVGYAGTAGAGPMEVANKVHSGMRRYYVLVLVKNLTGADETQVDLVDLLDEVDEGEYGLTGKKLCQQSRAGVKVEDEEGAYTPLLATPLLFANDKPFALPAQFAGKGLRGWVIQYEALDAWEADHLAVSDYFDEIGVDLADVEVGEDPEYPAPGVGEDPGDGEVEIEFGT